MPSQLDVVPSCWLQQQPLGIAPLSRLLSLELCRLNS